MYAALITILFGPIVGLLNQILQGVKQMNQAYSELRGKINELIQVQRETKTALEELSRKVTEDDATPEEIAEDIANITAALADAETEEPDGGGIEPETGNVEPA